MTKFNKIAVIGKLNITEDGKKEIRKLSNTPIIYPSAHPDSEKEMVERIGNSDAILASWENVISKPIIDQAVNLKYIGLCATSMANIDVAHAKTKGIAVTNVEGYGDEAPAEYIFCQLLNLVRGFGKYQWKELPAELLNKTIGIVGVGAVGKEVLRVAKGFGMKVLYTAKARKPDIETEDVIYTTLDELLTKSDIVTLHVPKNLEILTEKEFQLLTPGKILINTCLGKVFTIDNFNKWIEKKQNYAIFDRSTSDDYYKAFKDKDNVIFPDVIAGITIESKERLTQKVIDNITNYFENKREG